MKASLAASVLLIALVAPSASAQYIYVANAGEDTVSKIDINSNTEVARYATWFTPGDPNHVAHLNNPWAGPAPSRIAQDSAGNVYVLNRFFSAHLPVLIKIAPTGGTSLTTSNGSVALPMLDNGPTLNEIDAGDTKDARILWGKAIGISGTDEGAIGRALCMDTSGVLWVGMYHTRRYYKVDSTTGNVLGPPILTPGHTPYGCQVDAKGKLWSVDLNKTLAEIDTTTNQVTIHPHGDTTNDICDFSPTRFGCNYSLSLFSGCGSAPSKVYLSEREAKTYIAYDPQTSSFSNSPLAIPQFGSRAIAVDLNGDIISGQRSTTGRVIKTTPSGSVVWDTNAVGSAVIAVDQHGAIVDDHNNVWMVHLIENRVVKYNGLNGQWMATVAVGNRPYTYGNPPPPSCPCAAVREQRISCEKLSNGVATYPFSFTFTNNSPFAAPATAINITSTQATNITPSPFVFTNPVPVNGQGTVSGTFSVANPVPGSQVCLDIRLNAGEGWCCPTQRVCYVLPECPGCAQVKASFKCQQGKHMLQLMVTNQGPTAAQGLQVFSNTPGVTVSPQTLTQTFPQNTPVQVVLNVTGATPGQPISLTVSLNGPLDPKTGVHDWCCSTTVTVDYPKTFCPIVVDGGLFNDLNRNGLRDSLEETITGWTVTLTDAKGISRSTRSDANGTYQFENVEQGTYRLAVQASRGWSSTVPTPGSLYGEAVQASRGWSSTVPEAGFYNVTVGRVPERRFDFGFMKTPQ